MKYFKKSVLSTSIAMSLGLLLTACGSDKNNQPAQQAAQQNEQNLAKRIETKLEEIKTVANKGPFKPEWDSFSQYEIPAWYQDAKFGIFIHWGVYSVPAHNGEWYPRWMYDADYWDYHKHHVENYGPVTEFGYKDFIPMFKAEKFDADQWLKIIEDSGAKYIVPVAEHHDGFSMYDNSYTRWDSTEMGPKRDIIAELKEATDKTDIHFGLSSHRAENWWFFGRGRTMPSDVQDDAYRDLYGPAMDKEASENGETPPDQAFMDDWLVRTIEIVDKYEPELIWFDWWMASEPFHEHVKLFTSYYYNKGVSWENMPAINYKEHGDMRSYPDGSAVLDIERGQLSDTREYFWQTDTSVSKTSWGYVTNHKYRTANSLVDDLIDIVSKNGSLLLNIGPKPDGTIPEAEVKLLKEIGDWLKVNGEAIYSTRPWVTFGEGETEVIDGKHSNDAEKHRKDFTHKDIRFTKNEEALFATLLAWPGAGETITVKSINAKNYPQEIAKIEMLGSSAEIQFEQTANGLKVVLPAEPATEHAQVLKIIAK
ncbi:alpha-L-fucosidase [Catenovulum sediminis]|uniref:alpha-L-fucosidase n=1 Tax=Catenovulum sediminis TaxID=1740262 RepID=A0ABV1RGC2_9ALTE|nr:alpha-L-fucosidase [Catenovulum sediminis]